MKKTRWILVCIDGVAFHESYDGVTVRDAADALARDLGFVDYDDYHESADDGDRIDFNACKEVYE